MFRPQFFYQTPPGFRDEPYVRPVTAVQDPSGAIPSGNYLLNFIVQMDNDVDQFIRSLFWSGVQQGEGASSTAGSIQIQVRDPFGNYITDGFIPLWLYAWGSGSTPPDGGSGRSKVFESEIYVPRSGVFIFDFYNPAGTANYPGYFELRGIKRYPLGCAPS